MQHQNTLSELQFDNTINEIIRSNKAQRFGFELSHTTDLQRKTNILSIIKLLNRGEEKKTINQIENEKPLKKTSNVKSEKLDNIFSQFNDHILHGKWSKLTIFQKKERVNLYIKSLYTNENQIKDLINLLEKLIDEGKLKEKGQGKINGVEYDSKTCNILSITQKEYNQLIKKYEEHDNSESNIDLKLNTKSKSKEKKVTKKIKKYSDSESDSS